MKHERWEQSGSVIFCPDKAWVCIIAEPRGDRGEPINIASPHWDEAMKRAHLIETAPELLAELKVAYDAIKSLPIDCMGEGRDGELVWPIRDEVLDGIAKAIAKAEEAL